MPPNIRRFVKKIQIGNKSLFAAIDRNQIRDQLACYGQRGTIGVIFLLFPILEHRQGRAVSRRQLGRLDQNSLQMLVALFGGGRRWMV